MQKEHCDKSHLQSQLHPSSVRMSPGVPETLHLVFVKLSHCVTQADLWLSPQPRLISTLSLHCVTLLSSRTTGACRHTLHPSSSFCVKSIQCANAVPLSSFLDRLHRVLPSSVKFDVGDEQPVLFQREVNSPCTKAESRHHLLRVRVFIKSFRIFLSSSRQEVWRP